MHIKFKRYIATLMAVVLGTTAVVWWRAGTVEKAAPVKSAQNPAPESVPPFQLVTSGDNYGVDFVPENGAYGEKLLPETMGQGVAVVDLDGDGDLDLVFVNGEPWPWRKTAEATQPLLKAYQNDGKGHFQPIQVEGLGQEPAYGQAIAYAELNGDGKPDFYVTAVGENWLFLSGEQGYTRVRGAADGTKDEWSSAALFLDYDADGDLDLFVASYVRWSPELDRRVNYQLAGIGKAYGPPTDYPGGRLHLYKNVGKGQFLDATAEAGLQSTGAEDGQTAIKALALQALDADDDGDLDVFVANDTTANMLLVNQSDGTFRELGTQFGVAYDNQGHSTGAMGTDVYASGEGEQWLIVGNFANEPNSLYWRQAGADFYSDMAAATGMAAITRRALTFGVLFVDLNLDGSPEVFQVNGHVENEIARLSRQHTYAQAPLLLWRCRTCGLRWIDTGTLQQKRWVGRGLATGDLDGDGLQDLVLTQVARPAVVLLNKTPPVRESLIVGLQGRGENPLALGARVDVEIPGADTQRRWLLPVRGYYSQSDARLYFSRPKGSTQAARIRVRWPDGHVSVHTVLSGKKRVTIRQPSASP